MEKPSVQACKEPGAACSFEKSAVQTGLSAPKIKSMGVTEAGTYLSTLFTESSKNSMRDNISPKRCISKDILEFYPSS